MSRQRIHDEEIDLLVGEDVLELLKVIMRPTQTEAPQMNVLDVCLSSLETRLGHQLMRVLDSRVQNPAPTVGTVLSLDLHVAHLCCDVSHDQTLALVGLSSEDGHHPP